MGSNNSKRPKTFETHTSFDVLPTEYFNRRALQQKYQTQIQLPSQQQPIIQPQQQQLIPQPQQQQQPFVYQQPFYPAPVQQDFYSARLAFPQQQQTQVNQYYPQPLIQSYGMRPAMGPRPLFGQAFQPQQQQQPIGSHSANLPRKQYSTDPSGSSSLLNQQSIPKFIGSTQKFPL